MHLIGLDVGTTGCKAIVFDPAGHIKGHGYQEYEVHCTEPAMAEQDAEYVWILCQEALKQAVRTSGIREVGALSISVQGDAIIPVDCSCHALHPAILGMDYRSEPQSKWCEDHFGGFELFQRTGMRPHPINSLVKLLYLKERQPEVFRRSHKIMTYADFILGKFGAEAVIDYSMASRTMAFDLAQRTWCWDLLSRLDIDPDLLSSPVPSGTEVGMVRKEVADAVGLSGKVRLVTGGHDQPCAAIGAGVIRPGRGIVSTGSAEVLATTFAAPALTRAMYDGFYPCTLHARDGFYFTFALNHVGGLLLKWFRDEFCGCDVEEAKRGGFNPYQIIDAGMPDHPTSVMVVPHWIGSGTPTCDLQAKGAILGLTMATGRHEVARAILEGLTFELQINLETMRQSGIDVSQMVAVGGGAKSPLWLQMKADILRCPIQTPRCRESACLGAALLAGTASGVFASLEEAVSQTVTFDREFVPDSKMSRIYEERLAIYRTLYPLLKAVNPRL
ncbi:MAG TPA: FGGY-family carbohydrate kinase [Candidatus Paceibacterota bacterium]|nr:FGGY-family carbohydrate kinase [Verrucomicrobiota bacterium]HRY48110.1 FGGY-family carbohydrate kinase [Candidatus Paceibacterota bacterium]